MTAVNLNRAIRGPVTAVPVVAGKGVRIVPDVENNRFVVEADETVLFENDNILANWPGDKSPGQYSIVLSEDYKNFEKLEVHFARSATHPTNGINYVDTYVFKTLGKFNVVGSFFSSGLMYFASTEYNASSDGKTLTESAGGQWSQNSFNSSTCYLHIFKVVGINRIASN